jgi:hypothetical protein
MSLHRERWGEEEKRVNGEDGGREVRLNSGIVQN